MAIRQRGKKWYVDIRINGKRTVQVVGSRKEAQLYEGKIKAEIHEGRYFEKRKSQKKTLDDLFKEQLRLCKNGSRQIKASTYERYVHASKNLLNHFQSTTLIDVTPYAIKKYIDHRKSLNKSNATINRELAFLKLCFNQAEKWDWVQANPMKKVDMLKEPKGRVRYLSPDEHNRLLAVTPWYVRPIISFAMYSGMRKEEILSLKWKQVSFKDSVILLTDTKNGETRLVPLCDTAIAILKDVGQVRRIYIDYVFFNPLSDERWKDINKTFRRACEQADIQDFKFHDLRHTAASYLVMSGVDLNMVREILGHKTMTMTLRYAHLAKTYKVKAVKKLDGAFERLQKQELEDEMVTKWLQIGSMGEHLNYASKLNPSVDADKMAGETGLEPATAGFGNQSSTN